MGLVYETALLQHNASTEHHRPCSAHIYACRAFSRIGHFLAECLFCWQSCKCQILKSYDLCSTLHRPARVMENLVFKLITVVSSCKRYIFLRSPYNVFVAQWVESCYSTRKVRGSSPAAVMFFVASFYPFS